MKKIFLSVLCLTLALALLGCDITIQIGGKPVVGTPAETIAPTVPVDNTVAPTIEPPMPTEPVGTMPATEPTEPVFTEPTEPTEPTQGQCTHQFGEATCQKPATCSLCGVTTGTVAEHKYEGGNCNTPSACSVCGVSSGVMGNHIFNKANCTICGAENPKYAEIADALKKAERYPKYIASNKALIENNAEQYKLVSGDAKRIEVTNKVLKRVLEIHDYLNKMIDLCDEYKELEMLVKECDIEMPILPPSSSDYYSYILKAETYATKADRVSVVYNVLCRSYGVTE